MELSLNLINNLVQMGINVNSLSEHEQRYLSQINYIYEEYIRLNEELISSLRRNKFNKSIVVEKADFSRQTIYINPTLIVYIEWCERQAEILYASLNPDNTVSRNKYDRLKSENSYLLLNIVDNALKDSEIDRLAKENVELKKRIESLIIRYEEKNEEANKLKKVNKN